MRIITILLVGAVVAQGQNAAGGAAATNQQPAATNANQPANQQAGIHSLLDFR